MKISPFAFYIFKFMEKMNLTSNERYTLAVSGGMDSMAMAYFFLELKWPFSVIHINHKARASAIQDEIFVREFCKRHNIPLTVKAPQKSFSSSNFEDEARQFRRQVFLSIKGPVVLAQHLDDSFEWSLMKQFSQGQDHGRIGIPIKNGNIIRPFLSVSRAHIEKYMANKKYIIDPSNADLRYERNYLRHQVIPFIKARYPKYLKHYAHSMNELASALGKHCSRKPQQSLGLLAKLRKLAPPNTKGNWSQEILKIEEVFYRIQNNQKELGVKGPMVLSGGIHIFIVGCRIKALTMDEIKRYEEWDLQLLEKIETSKIPEIEFPIFPHIIINKNAQKRTSKLIHPLLPKTCQYLKINGISYDFKGMVERRLKFSVKT